MIAANENTAALPAHILRWWEIQQFYNEECALLDERRYEEWLQLLAPDILYLMPIARNVRRDQLKNEYTTEGQTCWFDEGHETLSKRVAQLKTGMHWIEEPASRFARIVSNVRILDDGSRADACEADSRFVLYQNRLFGKTGRSGKLLVTGLNSYEKNAIEIDPKSLPVDAVIPATKEIVMPAGQSGVKVDFGINTDNRAALVNLIDASGQPLEVGLQGQLDGSDQTFVVGYDGQTYIEGLRANNAISVTLNDGQECKAGFAYKPKKGEQGLIDAVTCR